MGMNVGSIDLGLDVNKQGFNKQLNGIAGGAQKSVLSAFKPLGKLIGGALAGAAVVSFTKSCLKLGSDLGEVQNVVDVTFQEMNGSVNRFAQNALEQFGLSETVAKKYMGTLGAMSKSMGFTEGESYKMAEAITGLSGDVASFYNLSSDEAYTKLKSIWTGETESLKELGVIMTQTNLDQYALNNGFGKTTKNMTEQTKTMLRFQYVMSSLSASQGDFARTSDSWANQTRVLSLRFDSLKATLGQGFINLFTPIVKMINLLVSKLQVLADSFKSFTEMITGKKSEASGLGSVATDVANATSATDGLSNSTAGVGSAAEKTAKQIKKSLLGIDQVNQLSDNSDSSSGNSTGGTGAGIDTSSSGLVGDMASSTEESSTRMVTALDKVKAKLSELTGIFKTGFELGLGDVNFDDIKGHVSGIKKSLKGIFSDPEVLTAADNWVDTAVLSFGKISGSAASIGLTTAEFYAGSIDKYLSENSGYIKDKIVSIFKISSRAQEITGDVSIAIADIFTVFKSDSAKQIGSDLISIFTSSFLESTELALEFGTDLLEAITSPFIENKDKIKEVLESTLKIIEINVGSIKGFFKSAFESVHNSYDAYIKPALDKISNGLGKVFSSLLDAYNEHIAPVLKKVSLKFDEFVKDAINPLVQRFTDMVGKIVDGVAEIWEKTLAPFIAWLIDETAPIIAEYIDTIAEIILGVGKIIADVIGDAIDVINGIVDFLVGVFTGDWDKAWQGIKDIFGGIIQAIKDILSPIGKFFKDQFDKAVSNAKNSFNGIKDWFKDRYNDVTGVFKNIPDWFKDKFTEAWTNVKNVFSSGGKVFDGIKDGIADVFKSVVNTLIRGINTVISVPFNKINSMIDTLKSIPGIGVALKGFSLPVPKIPALAQGGYVKANTPQLAMIGDNKHQGEVVAPESKLRELAIEAVRMAGNSGGLTEEVLYRVMARVFKEYMHIYIGDEDLARHVNNGNDMIDFRNNPIRGGAR